MTSSKSWWLSLCILFLGSTVYAQGFWGNLPNGAPTHTLAKVELGPASLISPSAKGYLNTSNDLHGWYTLGQFQSKYAYFAGIRNNFTGPSAGFYTTVASSNAAKQIGIWSEVLGNCPDCFAGIFNGNTVFGKKVSIGSETPREKLTVFKGNIGMGDSTSGVIFYHSWNLGTNRLVIAPRNASGYVWGSGLVLDESGMLEKYVPNSSVKAISVINNAVSTEVFRVNGDGKVYTQEVEILLSGTFPPPDYVFEDDYDLMSLDTLRNYIDANGHLPEMPTAKEIEENGNVIEIGKMNLLLWKKVEELTLYTLELEAQIKELRSSLGKN